MFGARLLSGGVQVTENPTATFGNTGLSAGTGITVMFTGNMVTEDTENVLTEFNQYDGSTTEETVICSGVTLEPGTYYVKLKSNDYDTTFSGTTYNLSVRYYDDFTALTNPISGASQSLTLINVTNGVKTITSDGAFLLTNYNVPSPSGSTTSGTDITLLNFFAITQNASGTAQATGSCEIEFIAV
jgi:hypothetical protein